MNLKDKILACNDHALQPIEVHEWDEIVYIRSWTGAERNAVTKLHASADMAAMYGKILVLSVADCDGNRLFTDSDIPALMEHNAAILERLVMKALEVNGISKAQVENAKND